MTSPTANDISPLNDGIMSLGSTTALTLMKKKKSKFSTVNDSNLLSLSVAFAPFDDTRSKN